MSRASSAELAESTAKTRQLELADIFRQHQDQFLDTWRVPARRRRVMQQIINCRTKALGGHRQWCARCGFERFLYHSCRNRHCPKCQTHAKEMWREARVAELIPVPYFHNVFTLPHEFNPWLLRSEANQRKLLNLLFETVSQTLLQFGQSEFGGKAGFTLVLHTWDQQLRSHYHLHCLIAAGALAPSNGEKAEHWIAGGSQFLFSVRGLSKMFRGKFMDRFIELVDAGELDYPVDLSSASQRSKANKKLRKKAWVVYSKRPFAGAKKTLDYLSRYTHRVAISNTRLIACKDGTVKFSYRDRTDGDQRKTCTLPVNQFIHRFLQHVLPNRFARVRHYGFLANRNKKQLLPIIRCLLGYGKAKPKARSLTAAEWMLERFGIDLGKCPCCGDSLRSSDIPSELMHDRRASSLIRGPPQ